MDDFFTKIDADQLSVVLADGTYKNDASPKKEFDYEQYMELAANALTFSQDNDFNDEAPYIGFDLTDSHILNYTLKFTPDSAEGSTNWDDLELTTLNMMGKDYFILSASNSTGSETLELLDAANSASVSEGDAVTVAVGDKTYEVSTQVFSSTEAVLTVNGETTGSMAEGDIEDLSDGSYVSIKDVRYVSKESGVSQVEFSIGAGKIKLVNGDEVQINDKDVSDYDEWNGQIITSYITQSSGKLQQLTLQWDTNNDLWLGFDTDSKELTLPGFGAVKLQLGNFVTDKNEITQITPSNDKLKLDTAVTDGSVGFEFLALNSTGTGFKYIGKDSDELLVTNHTANPYITFNMSQDSYFVATWWNGDDYESYVLEVSKIDDSDAEKNVTTIKSIASGSDKAVELDIGETDNLGEIDFYLVTANELTKTAKFGMSAAGSSGSVYADKLITAEGMKIQLPWLNATNAAGTVLVCPTLSTGDQQLNLITLTNATVSGQICYPTSWTMNFTEEDKDGSIDLGDSFTATMGYTTAGKGTVSAVSVTDYETSDSSDDYIGHVLSDLATQTLYRTGGDEDSLDITYYGSQAYGEVFLAEATASLGGSLGGVAVPILDTEVSSASGKNLIVVGGSCVNTVAAELLGGTGRFCMDEWTAKTGIGANTFLIQTFSRTGGKVATLVAGWTTEDTNNAATALTTQTVDTTVGKKYTGTTATSIESALA